MHGPMNVKKELLRVIIKHRSVLSKRFTVLSRDN